MAFAAESQPADKLFFQAELANSLTHLPWNNSMAVFAGLVRRGKPQSTETASYLTVTVREL